MITSLSTYNINLLILKTKSTLLMYTTGFISAIKEHLTIDEVDLSGT